MQVPLEILLYEAFLIPVFLPTFTLLHTHRNGYILHAENIMDDRKVNHLRETYKERLFSLNKIKINLKLLRYIEKYDFIR